MKPLLITASLVLLFGSLQAQFQTCTPDASGIPEDHFGLYPLPFIEEERPDGGITDTAVLQKDFEFTFAVSVSPTVNTPFGTVPVQSLDFPTAGAVTYDPPLANFDYVCNPPNCIFSANQVGCLKIFGTPTDPAEIGLHDLKFNGIVRSIVSIPITFPIESEGGNYYLYVKNCLANITLSESIITSDTYQASDQIIASGMVLTESSVVLKAGKKIQLLPGFAAESGSDFSAFNADCPEVSAAPAAKISVPGDPLQAPNVHLYPNPSKGVLTIVIPGAQTDPILQITLSDLSCRPIRCISIGDQLTDQLELDLSQEPKGMYLLSMRSAGAVITKRIVLQ